ncbi:MAG TPA: glutathione S-transferase family protein [Casimicrobiaceae bacterium]
MILLGRYRSPFTRRVAISLRCLGIEYEHRPFTAWTHLDEVRAVNPVGRIPALILDSGERLFDSAAILDYLDHLVGPARALVSADEPERREVLRVVACAMGALEKVVAALYEHTMRPAGKVHQPWIAHNEAQARGGIAWLEEQASGGWLAANRLTQADITTTAMFDFTRIVNPGLVPAGAYPRLDTLSAYCNTLPAFAETQPTSAVDRADPALPA